MSPVTKNIFPKQSYAYNIDINTSNDNTNDS